ncbi:MAG: hypothetical protein DCC71_17070 [Proteobacteria bacterium]|nr:MAG: hypothetical protein DCC71_17070 [Pseudomonadota bacterium]
MRAVAWLGRLVLVLCVVEGLASWTRLGALVATRAQRPLAERSHTEYDAELGWVNRPHVSLPDLYGPGASLHTNAQRFRGTRDVAPAVAPGRVRVVCSGDSFALGYGVADDATWCAQLGALDARIEPVNMGQGGYGIDQAYLWYRRDGAPLAHDVHLFTFIVEDFARMGATRFFGYGKPRLRLDGERLAVDNVPVPRAAFALPWLAQNLRLADELRSVALLRAAFARAGAAASAGERAADADVPRLAAAVFAELARLQRAAGRRLMLVYLPMHDELRDESTAALRAFVVREAQRLGVPFLDGVPALRALPPDAVASLYIPPRHDDFPAAAGHFTVKGNRWIAEWMLAGMRAHGALGP